MIGGELALSAANHELEIPLFETSELSHLKLRAGYDLGQGMVYGVVGASHMTLDSLIAPGTSIKESGSAFGLGYEHMVSDRMSVGAEYLRSHFDNVNGSSQDVDYDSIQARVSFRF